MNETLSYKRVRRYNVPGHVHFLTFSCYQRLPLLSNEVWRGWLGESVSAACEQQNVAIWAYVLMPEHVHLLVRPRNEAYDISRLLFQIKRPLAERVVQHLRENRSPLLAKLALPSATRRQHRFWKPGGGYDGNFWTWKKIISKAEYCHNNPVKRGLVKSPEQWRWSSFRWLEMGKRAAEPLRLDDWG